jgi:type II secretory pathway component GspD/PulD (secretin)
MKLKLLVLGLMGTLVFQQTAMTQTTTDTNGWPTNQLATATNAASSSAAEPASGGATVVVTNVTTVAIDTNAPAVVAGGAAPVADTNAPAAPAVDTNAPAATAASAAAAPATPVVTQAAPAVAPATPVPADAAPAAPAAAPADTTAAAQSAAPSIPLIEFQDVPLTVAIENLARQAGINYLLDPKIGYGQADANGQIKVEPTLSIRWENVTAEQALLALLNNYDLQLVEDTRTKIARISMKDPTAPPSLFTRVVQLKYASVSNMVQSVQAALTDRRSHVFPDVRTSQLVVVATENEQDGIDVLENELDKPTRQVLIETKLVEVSSTPSTAKGVNWAGTVANQNVSFGNGVLQPSTATTTINQGATTTTGTAPSSGTTTTTSSGSSGTSTILNTLTQPSVLPGGLSWNTLSGFTPGIGFLNADGVQAVLSFLNSSYDAQVVSTPRLVTLDNEAATISVTRQFPVINVTASTAGVSSGSSQISYSNIGTTLIVTPRITANDYIWLKVIPDVSSFFATITKVIAGQEYQADEFDARHIETQVMIPDANTLVMGGLIQDNPTATWNQVPVLGNIPVLGWAFKSEAMSMDKDNLIIFITPTIVKDDDFQPAPSAGDFLASKPTQMKEPMNPNSFWDKPEPDWSNPAPTPGEFQNNPVSSQ